MLEVNKTAAPTGGSYINIRVGEGHGIHQLKLVGSRFRDTDKDSEGRVAPGTPISRSGAPLVRTSLAAAAISTDTTIDVVSARGILPGDGLDVNGKAVVVAAGGVALGAGAGGSDRLTLTAAIGVNKALGLAVTGNGDAGTFKAVLGPSSAKVGALDVFASAIYTGLLSQARIEENLGRSLAAEEIAALPAAIRLL
jgi:hypothetical protein